MTRRAWRILAAAVTAATVAAAHAPADACDACLEDKIAATYDWNVVAAAAHRGHAVVFTALRGRVRRDDAALATAVARRAAMPGVDPGTVRVSLAPAAVSFACAPASATRLVAAINRRLQDRRLSLQIVRVGAPGPGAGAVGAGGLH